MANIFKKALQFLGLKKKKEKALDIASPYETPSYKRYKQRLEDMLAKRDVYTPGVMTGLTSPYAKSVRTGIKHYAIPRIKSMASAAGVGRSTIPVNIGAQKYLEGELSIGEKLAQLQLENEREKARREELAIEGLRQEAVGKAGVESARMAAHKAAKEKTEARQLAGLKRFGTIAGGAIGSRFGPAGAAVGASIGGSIFGGGGTQSQSVSELMAWRDIFGKKPAGVAKIAGANRMGGGRGGRPPWYTGFTGRGKSPFQLAYNLMK
jgi:hypothetical protein